MPKETKKGVLIRFKMKDLEIYYHDGMGVAYVLEEHFEAQGIRVNNHESCLCGLSEEDTEIRDKIVLLHPGDNEECWDRTREVIGKNPSSKFHIIAIGRPKRITGIGQLTNIEYLGLHDVSYFRQNIKKILEDEGFEFACTTNQGAEKLPLNSPLALKRKGVAPSSYLFF